MSDDAVIDQVKLLLEKFSPQESKTKLDGDEWSAFSVIYRSDTSPKIPKI